MNKEFDGNTTEDKVMRLLMEESHPATTLKQLEEARSEIMMVVEGLHREVSMLKKLYKPTPRV